jgi:hypothetical protein
MEKKRCSHGPRRHQGGLLKRCNAQANQTSARDAAALGMDSEAVVGVIQALVYPCDFEKSATAHYDSRQWQDSYKPVVEGRTFYLKFTLDETGAFLLTSFKEA